MSIRNRKEIGMRLLSELFQDIFSKQGNRKADARKSGEYNETKK